MEKLFKTLGDKNRLRIINILMNHVACVCEIESALDLLQTNVSRNLSKLNSAGVVTTERRAQWIYYHISDDFIKANEMLVSYLKKQFLEDEIFQKDLLTFVKINEKCNKECC